MTGFRVNVFASKPERDKLLEEFNTLNEMERQAVSTVNDLNEQAHMVFFGNASADDIDPPSWKMQLSDEDRKNKTLYENLNHRCVAALQDHKWLDLLIEESGGQSCGLCSGISICY